MNSDLRTILPARSGLILTQGFRAAIAIGVLTVLVSYAAVSVLEPPSRWAMIDMSEWSFHAEVTSIPLNQSPAELHTFFRGLQPNPPSRRKLRLTLMLPRIPKAGDSVSASSTVRVQSDVAHCFNVLVLSPYERPDLIDAVRALDYQILLNQTIIRSHSIATHKGKWITISGIHPADSEVTLEFRVVAHRDKSSTSWQTASLVHFEYARLYEC